MRTLITTAYAVRDEQVAGPGWLDSDRFDISAKIPRGTTAAQFRLMLQSLLADRFKMTIHRESRELPVYALVVSKGGPAMRASKVSGEPGCVVKRQGGDGPHPSTSTDAVNRFACTKTTATALAAELPRLAPLYIDRSVIDASGLTGSYDFALEWRAAHTGDDVFGATIFEAVEKLGLKLEERKAPVETIVIDHVAREPAGN